MIPIPAPVTAFFAKYGIALVIGVVAVGAIFYAGKLHERAANAKDTALAVERAIWLERSGQLTADKAELESLRRKAEQLENANAEMESLREQLKRVPNCPVPRAVVRMLDGKPRVPATAGAAREPRTTAQAVAPDTRAAVVESTATEPAVDTVDARDVLENCAWNRLHVAEPNATQIEELQRFYNDIRNRFNQQP